MSRISVAVPALVRRQTLHATVVRACRACGAAGTSGTSRCAACGANRPTDENLGEIWRKDFVVPSFWSRIAAVIRRLRG